MFSSMSYLITQRLKRSTLQLDHLKRFTIIHIYGRLLYSLKNFKTSSLRTRCYFISVIFENLAELKHIV